MNKLILLLVSSVLINGAFAATKNKKINPPIKTQETITHIELIKNINDTTETPENVYLASIIHKDNKNTHSNLSLVNNKINFTIETIDKQAIPKDEFLPLENGEFVHLYSVNSKMTKIEKIDFTFNPEIINYELNTENNSNSCKAFYLTYHLKGEFNPTMIYYFTDKNGNHVKDFDSKCDKTDVNITEELKYTKNNNSIGIFKDNLAYKSFKPVKYTAMISKNGVAYTPADISSFIISKDMKYFYVSEKIDNKIKNISGISYKKLVDANDYNIILRFTDNDKEEFSYSEIHVED